jgi:hypothetical protein
MFFFDPFVEGLEGKVIVNVVPTPSWLSTSIAPP